MLGTDDFVGGFDNFSNSMFRGMNGGILGKMLNNAFKMLEKEMQKDLERNSNNISSGKTNFQLFINGKKIPLGQNGKDVNIKVKKVPKKTLKELAPLYFSKDKRQEFLKLEKEEPSTNIKRLSDTIIYEVNMPGVNSLENISIIRLENSIEIKAIAPEKNKAYSKIIKIGLPIVNYELSQEKLVLELEAKN